MLQDNGISTSERSSDGFFLNKAHLKEVQKAKEKLLAKNPSSQWIDAERMFYTKIHNRNAHKTVYPT